MKKIQLMFLFLLFFLACKEKKDNSKNIYHIDRNKMTELLTDISLAEGNYKVANKYGLFNTKLIDSSYKFIYKKHNLEKWQVDSSFKYYANKPELLTEIVEDVIENLDRLEE